MRMRENHIATPILRAVWTTPSTSLSAPCVVNILILNGLVIFLGVIVDSEGEGTLCGPCGKNNRRPGKVHGHTKHTDIKYHFIHDAVEAGKIKLVYCASEDMIAALGVVDSFGFPCLSTSLPSCSDMHVRGLELGFGGLITPVCSYILSESLLCYGTVVWGLTCVVL